MTYLCARKRDNSAADSRQGLEKHREVYSKQFLLNEASEYFFSEKCSPPGGGATVGDTIKRPSKPNDVVADDIFHGGYSAFAFTLNVVK